MKLLRLDGSVLNSVDFKIRVNSELFIIKTKYFMKFILFLGSWAQRVYLKNKNSTRASNFITSLREKVYRC